MGKPCHCLVLQMNAINYLSHIANELQSILTVPCSELQVRNVLTVILEVVSKFPLPSRECFVLLHQEIEKRCTFVSAPFLLDGLICIIFG